MLSGETSHGENIILFCVEHNQLFNGKIVIVDDFESLDGKTSCLHTTGKAILKLYKLLVLLLLLLIVNESTLDYRF